MENILPTEDFIPPRGFYPSPDDFLPKGTRGAHQEADCSPLHPPKALESEEQGRKEIFLSSSATAAQRHAETDDRKQGLRNKPFHVKPIRDYQEQGKKHGAGLLLLTACSEPTSEGELTVMSTKLFPVCSLCSWHNRVKRDKTPWMT